MRKFLVCLFSFLFMIAAGAQFNSDRYVGKPYKIIIGNDDIQGSAFLFDDWKPAQVKLSNGTVINDMPVKFDIYQNRFYYLQNDTVYEFLIPVDEVVLFPAEKDSVSRMLIRKDHTGVQWPGFGRYSQVLAAGKNSLVKFYNKITTESYEYSSGKAIKQFKNDNQLYLINPSGAFLIKNIKKDSEKAFGNQWPRIEEYLASKKISLKTEKDLVFVIQYLNTL